MKQKKNIIKIILLSAGMVLVFARTTFGAGGWTREKDGSLTYANEDGVRLENQWFSIDSVPTLPSQKVYTTWYYAGEEGKTYRNGWFEIDGHWFYFNAGGGAARDSVVTVEDRRYYIDAETGLKRDGWFSVERVDSKGNPYVTWYYAEPDGALKWNGWYDIDGKTYYFDTGCASARKRWLNLEDKRYYLDENGVKQNSGWFAVRGVDGNGKEYANWYYAESDGNLARGGFAQKGDHVYYFDPNGLNYRKRWLVDDQAKRYYFNEDGHLQKGGWFTITTKNATTGVEYVNRYYADESGSVLKGGYREVDGKTYYFDASGTMYKARWMTEGKVRKYLGADGRLYEKEWFSISGTDDSGTAYTNWYYATDDGRVLKNGWHSIGGKEYYLDGGGKMLTGWVDGNKYYCGPDGARLYGWQWLPLKEDWLSTDEEELDHYIGHYGTSAWFYFQPESGKVKYASSGTYREIEVDGLTYCVDERGIVQLGWIKHKSSNPVIRGYKYYAEKDTDTLYCGQRVEKAWMNTIGPDEDCTGEVEWFYFQTSGTPVSGPRGGYEIETIDNKRYLFDEFGNSRYGLREVDGEIYYFGASAENSAAAVGKCMIDDGDERTSSGRSEYYFDDSGKGVTGRRDGRYYYRGKLQCAAKDREYEAINLPGVGVRLVNTSGKIIKNRTVKDSAGDEWKLASNGEIVSPKDPSFSEVTEPEPVTD